MATPPLSLLIRAHLFNHLTAKIHLAHRYYTESRWNAALTGISNRETHLAATFEKGRLRQSELLRQVEQLALIEESAKVRAHSIDPDVKPRIDPSNVLKGVHLRLLAIHDQLKHRSAGGPRQVISRMIQEVVHAYAAPSSEDAAPPAAPPADAVYQQRSNIPEQTTIHRAPPAPRDPFDLPEWWEPARMFRSSALVPPYANFYDAVETAVGKALRSFEPGHAPQEEARCRLTFEQLMLLRQQQPWNAPGKWALKRSMLDVYSELMEKDAVQRLRAARRGGCADPDGPQRQRRSELAAPGDSAVDSLGSIITYVSPERPASCSEADDSDTWSVGGSDAAPDSLSMRASGHESAGTLVT